MKKEPTVTEVKSFLNEQGVNSKFLEVSCKLDTFDSFDIYVTIKDSDISINKIKSLIVTEFGYNPIVSYDPNVRKRNNIVTSDVLKGLKVSVEDITYQK